MKSLTVKLKGRNWFVAYRFINISSELEKMEAIEQFNRILEGKKHLTMSVLVDEKDLEIVHFTLNTNLNLDKDNFNLVKRMYLIMRMNFEKAFNQTMMTVEIKDPKPLELDKTMHR